MATAKKSLRAIISGSGRCGTLSLAEYLDGLSFYNNSKVVAKHETEREKFLELLDKKDYKRVDDLFLNFNHEIEVSPYISLTNIRILPKVLMFALIRDGRKIVASGMNMGWFLDRSFENKIYQWERFLPNFEGNRFSKCCQTWTWVYNHLTDLGSVIIRLEDISTSIEIRNSFLETLLIKPNSKKFPISNSTNKDIVRKKGYDYLPEWSEWDLDHKEIFKYYCGKLMDRYYPEIKLDD